jgi:hypothetical protein
MTDDQLPLALGPSNTTRRANRISKRASKARRRLPVIQPTLIDESGYRPVAGVPRTRGECPDTKLGPCVWVRCRYHLFREDAETRAGRPGLASVPRDEKGLTISQPGDAGKERPGTTLRPAWLKVRGLEVEREVKVYLGRGEDGGIEISEMRSGTLDYWLERLNVGEPVLAFDDDTGELVAKAKLKADGALVFDRDVPESLFASSSGVVLTRVRGVSSCALDLADAGKHSNDAVGDAIGRHRTLAAREVKRAMKKVKAMGFDLRDLVGEGS